MKHPKYHIEDTIIAAVYPPGRSQKVWNVPGEIVTYLGKLPVRDHTEHQYVVKLIDGRELLRYESQMTHW